MTARPAADPATRPRVEGDREQELYEATLDLLADVGYDRLTMDAVASAARASKATLYRRWSSKASLVIDALHADKVPGGIPDTGTLRGDLIALTCRSGGLTDQRQLRILASVLTAIARDEDFAEVFRRDVLGPKAALLTAVFQRARARGELREDVDLDVVVHALPGIVLHRQFMFGTAPDTASITAVIDQIVLPAVVQSTKSDPPALPAHSKDQP